MKVLRISLFLWLLSMEILSYMQVRFGLFDGSLFCYESALLNKCVRLLVLVGRYRQSKYCKTKTCPSQHCSCFFVFGTAQAIIMVCASVPMIFCQDTMDFPAVLTPNFKILRSCRRNAYSYSACRTKLWGILYG